MGLANPVLVYDFGPRFDYVNQTGLITRQPPAILRVVPALAAQVDADGNETSGVPSVQMMAPLGSYLSWNRYREGPIPGNSAPSTPVSCPLRAPRRSAWLQATAGLRSRSVIIRVRVTSRLCRRLRPRLWPSAFAAERCRLADPPGRGCDTTRRSGLSSPLTGHLPGHSRDRESTAIPPWQT
jgi:hypothetical protein